MSEPLPPLRTHAAPPDLVQRALFRADEARQRPRRMGPVLLAAVFLIGLAAGRYLPTPGPTAAELPMQASGGVVEVASRPVRFVFTAPDAKMVSIAGRWNDWQPEAAPMVRGEGGRFYAEIELGTGQYEYQFVVDGERWVADPAAALARDDGFGRKNSVITI